jgi:NAD(P)-dependent dehydrogenase (short-subunit alcohol dehydrogenase family)
MIEQASCNLSLDGRVALVTGGSGGIGSAVVRLFMAARARVVSADLADRPGPAGAVSIACDVSRVGDVAAAVAATSQYAGRIDYVVHCAGITRDALIAKMSDEEWSSVLATNLDSAFYLLRSAGSALRDAGGGAIVLVSSINAERGKAGQANYAASKAGLNALAKTAARELGRFGIRVNVVEPGWIDTPMTAALSPDLRNRAVGETLLGRIGRPEDVAGAVLFLCSDLSQHITGQVLRVDGGQLVV